MAVIGAKRALNLSRHLPKRGWRPVILCSQPTREPIDPRLTELVGEEAIISPTYRRPQRPSQVRPRLFNEGSRAPDQPPAPQKTSRLERLTGWQWKYLGPFDRELVEVPHAIREASRLVREHSIDAIAVSVDPWSALITASVVSRRFNLPLIVDFRDPWTLHSGKSKLRPPLTLAIMRRFERRLFARAARVILNTESCEQAYRARDGHLWPADRVTHIRNSFDSSMFGEWAPPRSLDGRAFELIYFGNFRKFVRPDALFAGIATFVQQRGLSPEQFKLVLVGGIDAYAYEAAQRLSIMPWIDPRPKVSFLDGFEVLQGADALALVDGGCPLVIAGKLYDYLGAGRPILSVARSAEVDRVISASGAGISSDPDHIQQVADDLAQLYERALSGEQSAPDSTRLAPFDAPAQAERYARVLDEALSTKTARGAEIE